MSLFKILRGDSSRISLETTPFHDGWCYYCLDDNGFYIDAIMDGVEDRRRINPESIVIAQGAAKRGYVMAVNDEGNVVPMRPIEVAGGLSGIVTWGHFTDNAYNYSYQWGNLNGVLPISI